MKRHLGAIAIAGLSLLIAGCSSTAAETNDQVPTSSIAQAASTTTVPAEMDEGPANDAISPPSAIISLSPTATEMLYAIGAGEAVIAVDDYSNYPPAAIDKQPGISGYEPNVEAILALGADLIITDGTNPDLIDAFERAGVANWAGPASVTIDDTFAQLLELGSVTGRLDAAEALVGEMKADLDDLTARIAALPASAEPLTYYHELDSTYYSVTSDTFIGSTYSLLGLRNIADLAEGESYGYPQLSAEFILDKDPDLIFLACTVYCGETPESVTARPGWDSLSAVSAGHVFPLDDDTASRWGPRVIDHMTMVVDAVEMVLGAGAE